MPSRKQAPRDQGRPRQVLTVRSAVFPLDAAMKCNECGRDNEEMLLHWEDCSKTLAGRQRRRYALLQAAATIDATFAGSMEEAVTRAEQLLSEIKKREGAQ